MEPQFLNELFQQHQNKARFPPSRSVCEFTTSILECLFPELSTRTYGSYSEFEQEILHNQNLLLQLLYQMTGKLPASPEVISGKFFDQLPYVFQTLHTDIAAIVQGDPAARDEFEVVRAYPGFYAIALYRLAHELHLQKVPVLPRIITEYAHAQTGIDIHPGATIGTHFCIDHGTGVVIGETTVIGSNVKLYQGVTLGALSVDKSMAEQKRHPTLEDHVVVYSGATILGGNTIIGSHSVIGGNVWVTKSIPSNSTIYYRPQGDVNLYKLEEGNSSQPQ